MNSSATNIDTSNRSSLVGSLTGLLKPRYYVLTNRYPKHEGQDDEGIRGMVINPKSLEKDANGMKQWLGRLEPTPNVRWYYDKQGREAHSKAVLKTLETPRHHPTFIYIAGHTEPQTTAVPPLAYAPADYLEYQDGKPQLVSYETMRGLLLKNDHSAPLIFITEVCFCENFLQLPYALECKGNEARWVPTGYPSISTINSSDIVHFAATSPGERALSFASGAVFTKAFYNINPSVAGSLKNIMEQLQGNVNTILSSEGSNRSARWSQHPKVYASRIIDDPHFFAALGFHQ
ncbi:hypothetical protein OPQ81_008327 [Rhizoctonia solani]|nr:hypothetical protein OPQ81_008327 [Rhizoctonia solani]